MVDDDLTESDFSETISPLYYSNTKHLDRKPLLPKQIH